ncbi:sensor histidine kinase [Cellulosimicrobium cellulans]|uniref:sensor histidine kinase n=1 Tax=Cellulosimicrobium cellulans TaxID=1710 RepID=UPI00130E65FF|nr:histidine kinase [Cellulosimicrobium cellulans]
MEPTRRRAVLQDVSVALAVLVLWTVAYSVVERSTYWFPRWFDVYLWVGVWLAVPLAVRRVAPGVGWWLTLLVYPFGYELLIRGEELQSDFHVMPVMLGAYAATRAGAVRPLLAGVLAVGCTLGMLLGIRDLRGVLTGHGLAPDLSQYMLLMLLTGGATALGAVFARLAATTQSLEERNAELQALQAVQARAAVRAERTRIARELHDVVAHHVSAIVVRAQAAGRVADTRPEELRAAVEWIAPAGKEALGAMRSVVRVLREADKELARDPESADDGARAPVPGLTDLGAVLDRVRGAGLRIDADLPRVMPACGPEAGLAVVRVAQEALTNVLMHSTAGRASVSLAVVSDRVRLTVQDAGPARPVAALPEGGNGLEHMRERATSCGGVVRAGPTDDGGWQVRMWVPYL